MGILITFIITVIFYSLFKSDYIDYNNQSIIYILFMSCIFLFCLYFSRTKRGTTISNRLKTLCWRSIKQLGFKTINFNSDDEEYEDKVETKSDKKAMLEKRIESMYRYKGNMDYSELCYFEKLLLNYKNQGYSDYKKYFKRYVWMLESKLQIKASDKDYSELIDMLIDEKQYNKAKLYCEIFYEFHECEASYLKFLKYYYVTRDEKNFKRVFDDFTSSTVKFSEKGIEIVKFWIS